MPKQPTPGSRKISLAVERGEAIDLLQRQLATIRAIPTGPFLTTEGFREAANDLRVWKDVTSEILRQISDSDQLATDFEDGARLYARTLGGSLSDQVDDYRMECAKSHTSITSVIERIKVIPEAARLTEVVPENWTGG